MIMIKQKIYICCVDINFMIQCQVKHIYVAMHTGLPDVTNSKVPIQRNMKDDHRSSQITCDY